MEKQKAIIMWIVIAVVVIALIILGVSYTGGAVTSYQCNDRKDNDGDGRCDYSGSRKSCLDGSVKGDTGCSNNYDTTEASCVPGSTTCGVGECVRSSTCANDQVSCTPGTPTFETCNNKDDDCDGSTDESLIQQCGYSNLGACEFGTTTCTAGAWGSCQGAIYPTNETCDGIIDEDCDGVTDEGCQCTNGQTKLCGTDIGECEFGTETCSGGRWGACVGEVGPAPEICGDGKDNDCNGIIDNGCSTNTCTDTDGGVVPNVQGTVSGLQNGNPYSYTDYCLTFLDDKALREYSCSGNSYIATGINCTTTCSGGRCI